MIERMVERTGHAMQQFSSDGVHEFSGSLCARPQLLQEVLSFSTRHVQNVRLESAVVKPSFQMHTRNRSADGFTLGRSRSMGAHGKFKEVRGATEIARDKQNRFFYIFH